MTRCRSGRSPLVGLLLLPLLLAACSDNKGPAGPTFGTSVTGTASNGQFVLTVNINPNNVEPGQRAGITVRATTVNGAPLEGREVQLSTTHGVLDRVAGVTDAAGRFVAFITIPAPAGGNTPGNIPSQVTITATVDGLQAQGVLNVALPGALQVIPGTATLAPGARQFFNCVGGVPPYRWEPSGGTLDVSTGPTVRFTAGTALGQFTLKCTDSAGNAAAATITIATERLSVVPGSVTLNPGQTQVFQAAGGVAPFTWSFPAGAGTLSSTTGPSIALTAGTTAGTFTLILTDATGQTASASVTIQVPGLALLPSSTERRFGATGDPPGLCTIGTASVTLTVTGGVPPYTFSATAGTVTPPVLGAAGPVTYSLAVGTVSGGFSTTETVTVLDSRGVSATATVTVSCTPSTS